MTLTEYLNQASPVRGARVFLQEGEFVLIGKRDYQIPVLWTKLGIDATYCTVGESRNLYVADSDGNAKEISVFRLP